MTDTTPTLEAAARAVLLFLPRNIPELDDLQAALAAHQEREEALIELAEAGSACVGVVEAYNDSNSTVSAREAIRRWNAALARCQELGL